MRKLSLVFIFLLSLSVFAQAQDSYISSVNEFRNAKNKEFLTIETSPYCDAKLFTKATKNSNGLKWFEIDANYKIAGKIKLTPNDTSFENPTFGNKESLSVRRFGIITFSWNGQPYSLNVYEFGRAKNFIFVPFYDLTNQDETYVGGRYVNISKPVGDNVTIDFNLSYNPDCAFGDCNICLIPSSDNRLPFRVEAGEKLYERKVEKSKKDKQKVEKSAKMKEEKPESVERPLPIEKIEKKPETVKPVKVVESTKIEPIAGKYADFDGVRVGYQEQGKGDEAIVFIHGWTCNSDFWKAQMSAFPDKRLIAIDLPGHGISDKPAVNYTMNYFAKSIDAVMKRAGVKRAVLVGHSMGTPVIRQFYRLFPEKVTGLVIVDGALRPFAPKAQMDIFMAPLKTDYKTNAPMFMEQMLGNIKDENIKKQIRNTSAATPDYVALSAMEAMSDESIFKADPINVPVLAILSDSSFGQQKDIEQFLRSIIPNLDFRMWQGASHFLMMENPQAFNQALKFFLNKNKL